MGQTLSFEQENVFDTCLITHPKSAEITRGEITPFQGEKGGKGENIEFYISVILPGLKGRSNFHYLVPIFSLKKLREG